MHSIVNSKYAKALVSWWLVVMLLLSGELAANAQWHDLVHAAGCHDHGDESTQGDNHGNESEHNCAAKMLASGLVDLADPKIATCLPVPRARLEQASLESHFADRLDVSVPPSCGPPGIRISFL